MNKLNISMIVLTLAVAGNAVAMQNMFQRKPKTTAGEMAAQLRQARKNVRGKFKQVKQEAMNGTVGETVALKNELNQAVNDLTAMGAEVGGMAEELAQTADVGFEFMEDAIKDNDALKKNPKLKKRALNFISEARGLLPILAG